MPLKIAIIGAGPAGCMLARLLLHKQKDTKKNDKNTSNKNDDIDVTIFEGEPSFDFRAQGGTLDLHTAIGIAALKQAGLYEEFLREARYDGEATVFSDKRRNAFISIAPATGERAGGRPEIDCWALRRILLESLPAERIWWNKRLRAVSRVAAGTATGTATAGPVRDDAGDHLQLEFTDGTTQAGFDLIVGADGAWSKVRSSLLSTEKPFYAGVGGFSFSIPDAATTAPDSYKLVNRGNFFAYDGWQQKGQGRSIMASSWATAVST
ncbi:hypothetical protein VTN77DRAFT_2291 [Rasamsonia byssochlamydoides]|uniref:uncharacterized protein n=1 Tax=Rasamsonia byssochlamydoides TaxID=89139 RepID=UPI0037423576